MPSDTDRSDHCSFPGNVSTKGPTEVYDGANCGESDTGRGTKWQRGFVQPNNIKAKVQLPASCDPPGPGAQTTPLVWIVFGGTGHMGHSVVQTALAHGDLVTIVGRSYETTPAAIQALAATAGPKCTGTLCDVRSRESVERVVRRALNCFERIDVVANCSGYGVMGACEDQDEHEVRNQFETNFMGTVHILQSTLPIFRKQRDGRYLIFSSTAGALGIPGMGPYCSTKYAVEGLVEAVAYEADPFNIKATLIEPGLVRRENWAASCAKDHNANSLANSAVDAVDACGLIRKDPGKQQPTTHWGHFLVKAPSMPYVAPTAPARHVLRMIQWLGDRQPTSVVQCAELIWQLAHCSFPPLRLPLGSYAIESIRDRLRCVTEELEDWKHLHFPLPPQAVGGGSLGGATEKEKVKDGRTGPCSLPGTAREDVHEDVPY